MLKVVSVGLIVVKALKAEKARATEARMTAEIAKYRSCFSLFLLAAFAAGISEDNRPYSTFIHSATLNQFAHVHQTGKHSLSKGSLL